MSLAEKLFGKQKPLSERLAEIMAPLKDTTFGSYKVEKVDKNVMLATNQPNIIDRIKGKKTETTIIDRNKLRPIISSNEAIKPIEPIKTTKFAPIQEPRKENLVNKVRAKVENAFGGNNTPQVASVIQSQEPAPVIEKPVEIVPTQPARLITKDKLVFQESNVGNGLPYYKQDNEIVPIDVLAKTIQIPEVKKPIKRIVITDPKEGKYIIDTPEKLAIANEIKAIADEVAPEYTNYLLKLAQKEGGYDHNAIRPEDQNPGGGVDRGIFQINSKYFPTVTDEMARDIRFSVLWAISLIESATPKKGDGRRSGQEKWIADEAVRRSNIEIE